MSHEYLIPGELGDTDASKKPEETSTKPKVDKYTYLLILMMKDVYRPFMEDE